MCKGRLEYAQASVLVYGVFLKVLIIDLMKFCTFYRFFLINSALLNVAVLLS